MRKTYSFLKKHIYIMLACLLVCAIFGVICFSFMYDEDGYSLRFPHVVTILFYLSILLTVFLAVFGTVKAKKIEVTRIKKNHKFLQFASVFCAIMMFVFFIYECVVSITKANFQLYFFFRVARWLLTIPTCAYFVIEALPKKIHHKKIAIPTALRIFCSVCAVLWGVFGVLTTYFSALPSKDVAKITQLLVYASISIFLVFEGEFEFVKTRRKPYMITAFICAALTFSFPFGISVAKIIGQMSPYRAFSHPELLVSVAIGIYALARMFALVSTMHMVIENSKTGSHSSRFDKKTATAKDSGVKQDADKKAEPIAKNAVENSSEDNDGASAK